MREIATTYLKKYTSQTPPITPIQWLRSLKPTRQVLYAGALGLASSGLYVLLYYYGQDLTALATEAHNGHKTLFFVPILVALVFSLAHGSFTGQFWDLLGIKPKK